jgi:hypothetical protein
MVADIKMPGRVHRLKEWLISQLPYHRQYLPAGARFTAELKAPVGWGPVQAPVSERQRVGSIPPSIAVLIAATSATPDTDVRPGRVYTDTDGPASGQIIGGGLGYKAIGMAMALAMRYQPVTAGFAAYGAAMSVYSHLLSRGQDVVFPKDTPMEILLGEHRSVSFKRGRPSVSDKQTRS